MSNTITRTGVLMGRMHKLENYQAKQVNLMDGIVMGGELPEKAKEYFRSETFKKIAIARIDKAERIKLTIAIEIYNDIF